jgi:hypothetical protein
VTNFFESKDFVLASEIKDDLTERLKKSKRIKTLELHFKGDDLKNAKKFSESLVALRKNGTRISHEFSIRLSFPQSLSRQKALEFIGALPKPVNGSMKVRIELNEDIS